LFPKCVKTLVLASAIPKKFLGLYLQTPVKRIRKREKERDANLVGNEDKGGRKE
jgi:hypothetical protein